MNEEIDVYDRKGDFLGTCASEAEAEAFCQEARENGFNPCLIGETYDLYEIW